MCTAAMRLLAKLLWTIVVVVVVRHGGRVRWLFLPTRRLTDAGNLLLQTV